MTITNRFARWSAVVMVAAALALSGGCAGKKEREAKYLESAREHLNAGDYDKARIDAKNVLQINANNADARYVLAEIDEKDQNWRQMFGDLQAALQLDPDHVGANIKIGQLYLMSNALDKAASHADTVLKAHPKNADALALKANIALRKQDKDTAEKEAKQALELDPGNIQATGVLVGIYQKSDPGKALALVETAMQAHPDNDALPAVKLNLLRSKGDDAGVVAELQRLIKVRPDDTKWSKALAAYYARTDRLDEAEKVLRQTIKAHPDDVEPKLWLVQFLVQRRGTDAAISELKSMLAADPKAFKLRDALGELYVGSKQFDKAQSLYKEVFDYDANGVDSVKARNNLAIIALLQNDPKTAKKWLAEALKIDPQNTKALLTRARIAMASQDYESAVPDLRTVLRQDPESVPALLMLGDAQEQQRAVSLALSNYEKVLAVDPHNLTALFRSARLQAQQGDYGKAGANLERLLEKAPKNIQAINLLADIYARQKRWDDARDLTRRLAGDKRTKAVADLLDANLALRQGQFDKAASLGKSALEGNEKLVSALEIIASAYVNEHKPEKAVEYIESYLKAHSDNGEAYETLARVYVADNNTDKAVENYEKAIDTSPGQISAYMRLGQLYTALGRNQDAIALYQRGIKSNSDNVALMNQLAVVYQTMGEQDKAKAQLEAAYKTDPYSKGTANNLASLLIDYFPTAENLRRAQDLTAGFADEDNAAMLDTIGWLQYKLGNYSQSLQLLKRAASNGGTAPVYRYHLGMAYLKAGLKDDAKKALEQAVAGKNANYVGIEEARKTLASLGT